MWLQACLNGSMTRADHPRVPVTPDELAADAALCLAAGAHEVHVHPRNRGGAESLEAGDVAAAVTAIRASVPGVVISVSTGVWMTGGDPDERAEILAGWADLPAYARPDLASCNMSEPGWEAVWESLTVASVGLEAGVWSLDDWELLQQSGRLPSAARVLLEVLGTPPTESVELAGELQGLASSSGVPCLLHGDGDATWPILQLALAGHMWTRVGLEDTDRGRSGRKIGSNAELVRGAVALHAELQ